MPNLVASLTIPGTLRRLLYISPFAFAVSGADESLLTIIQNLRSSTLKIHVAIPRSSPYLGRYLSAADRVFRLPIQRLRRSKNPLFWIFYAAWLPVEVAIFAAWIRWHRYDLVHVNMESSLAPAIAAKIVHVPCVIHYRGKTVDTPTWFFSAFLPTVSRLADRVIAISRASAQGFFTRGLVLNLTVLHNPVDVRRFENPSSRDFFAPIRDRFGPFVVTFIGRFDPQKRIVDLIEGAKILRTRREDFSLVLVGGDDSIPDEAAHRNRLRTLANEEPWIIFHGPERDIPAVLASSSVLVLPSENEGFGRVVVEALASRTPVIAANSGALPEILDGGKFGTLVDVRSPPALAKAIDAALSRSPEATEAITRAGHEAAWERYSIERTVDALREIYGTLWNRAER